MRYIQRCKQRQWDIYKDVNKGNDIYTKMQTKAMRYIQRCKQGNQIYTKMQTKATSDIQRCNQRQ